MSITRRTLLTGTVATVGAAALHSRAPAASAADKVTPKKAKNGMTASLAAYRIYLDPSESAVVQQAASELSSYLNQILGTPVAVVSSATAPTGPLLVVGRKSALAAALTTIDYSALSEDGFAFRTDTAANIYVAGPSDRGTLYGAYWFLDRLLGVRWYAPGVTVVPSTPNATLSIADLNSDKVPRFDYRGVLYIDAADFAYRQHNLLNGSYGYEECPQYPGINTWSDHWAGAIRDLTLQEVLDDPQHWSGTGLLAMSTATRSAAAAALTTQAQKQIAAGRAPNCTFHQADGWWRPDPDSAAFAQAHGGNLAAPLIDMVNDVAGQLKSAIPHARVETQAYLWSEVPPAGMTVADNVQLTYAPLYADRSIPWSDPRNSYFEQNLSNWSGLVDDIVVWSYVGNFSNWVTPYPTWRNACTDIQNSAAIPQIKGFFIQGARNTAGAEMALMRVWVFSRLLWDPTLDADALISEFANAYFGAAGPSVTDYMQTMHTAVQTDPSGLGSQIANNASFTLDVIMAADAALQNAETAVTGAHASRVRHARMGVDYVILLRQGEYEAEAARRGLSWTAGRAVRQARFNAAVAASGLTYIDEPGGSVNRVTQQVAITRTDPTAPALAAGAAGAWYSYQDFSFTIWPKPAPEPVSDPLASDSAASRFPGSEPNRWQIQFELDQLPPVGKYKLYVSARVDAAPGASPTTPALLTGVWLPKTTDVNVSVPASTFADGKYHEIEIPGTYTRDAANVMFVGPPAQSTINNVYIDRIIAVEDVDIETTTAVAMRTVAGKKYVSVSVTNDDAITVGLTIDTAYGSKAFADVKPGKTVTASINSRLSSIPDGSVTVTAKGTVSGVVRTTTTATEYSAG